MAAKRINAQLEGNELLFCKQFDSPEFTSTLMNDATRVKNYMQKVRGMSLQEQKDFRNARDIRYLHSKPAEVEHEERQFCPDQLNFHRTCYGKDCGKWHQIRNPRIFGVCKFFIRGACNQGTNCNYMHGDFPCRYFYLDLEHPNDSRKCLFMHGGPLPPRMSSFFINHLKHWTNESTENRLSMDELVERFERRQEFLRNQHRTGVPSNGAEAGVVGAGVVGTGVVGAGLVGAGLVGAGVLGTVDFSLDRVLSARQIALLAANGFTTAIQINRIPIDSLLDEYRLSMDQILQISQNCVGCKDEQPTDTAASSQSSKPLDVRGDIDIVSSHQMASLEPNLNKDTQAPIEMPKVTDVQMDQTFLSQCSSVSMITNPLDCDMKINKVNEPKAFGDAGSDSDDTDSCDTELLINEDFLATD